MKSKFVSFRVSEEELKKLNEAAERSNVNRSEFIRELIFQNMGEEKRDSGDRI